MLPPDSPSIAHAPPQSRIHRNIWVLTLASFLTDVSSEMLFNLLPLFLQNVLGVRTGVIGLIEGVAETTASLVKVASGVFSDRIRRRKRLAVLGYGLSTLAKPFLYFATSWPWVLGVRFVDRMGKGIRTAPRDALLAASATGGRRGLAFGLHRAGDTAGAFVGLGIATWIIWATQAEATRLARPTFQWVVLASVIPAILAVVTLAVGAREIAPSASSQEAVKRERGLRQLDHRFRVFLVVMALFTLGNSSDAFIILRGQERGLSLIQLMAMMMTFNAVYAALSGPLGSLSDSIGRGSLLLGGWLLYGLIYLGLAVARSGTHIWVLFGLYGVYYAATEGTAKALVADLVPEARRGTAYGLYNAVIGFSALPASLIAGGLWEGVGGWPGLGPAAPFYFGALMALMATGLFLLTLSGDSLKSAGG